MVLLEIIIIGGAVYYYKKHHKVNKARKAAFLAGNPFVERDGSVTYPPSYPGLPSYTQIQDNKVQSEVTQREYYADAPAIAPTEKTGLMAETREIVRDEKI